jgi:hypothetical protein
MFEDRKVNMNDSPIGKRCSGHDSRIASSATPEHPSRAHDVHPDPEQQISVSSDRLICTVTKTAYLINALGHSITSWGSRKTAMEQMN